MTEERLRYLWKLLCRTDRKAPHCFKYGCGKDTLSYWVRSSVYRSIHPTELRKALLMAVDRGWADMIKTPGRCTKFKLKY